MSPAVEILELEIEAVTFPGFTNVVVRSDPLKFTTEVLINSLPVTVRVNELSPAVLLAGIRLKIVNTAGVTSRAFARIRSPALPVLAATTRSVVALTVCLVVVGLLVDATPGSSEVSTKMQDVLKAGLVIEDWTTKVCPTKPFTATVLSLKKT